MIVLLKKVKKLLYPSGGRVSDTSIYFKELHSKVDPPKSLWWTTTSMGRGRARLWDHQTRLLTRGVFLIPTRVKKMGGKKTGKSDATIGRFFYTPPGIQGFFQGSLTVAPLSGFLIVYMGKSLLRRRNRFRFIILYICLVSTIPRINK